MLVRSIGYAVLLAASAQTADAAWQGFTAIRRQQRRLAGMQSRNNGERGIWVGHFSGRRYAGGEQGTAVYGRRGWFRSEAECRGWLGLDDAFAAASTIMSCRPLGGQAR